MEIILAVEKLMLINTEQAEIQKYTKGNNGNG